MLNKIKCLFGYHKWVYIKLGDNKRKCANCLTWENRVNNNWLKGKY